MILSSKDDDVIVQDKYMEIFSICIVKLYYHSWMETSSSLDDDIIVLGRSYYRPRTIIFCIWELNSVPSSSRTIILSSKDDNILFLGIEFRPVLVQGRDDIQFWTIMFGRWTIILDGTETAPPVYKFWHILVPLSVQKVGMAVQILLLHRIWVALLYNGRSGRPRPAERFPGGYSQTYKGAPQ